jgi:hypothetical protein
MDTKVHSLEDGRIVFETAQDVSSILEDAKARHNQGMTGLGEMRHAARIPLVVVEKYCNDNNIPFHEFMGNKEHIRRVLTDPSLSAFRIWQGKI